MLYRIAVLKHSGSSSSPYLNKAMHIDRVYSLEDPPCSQVLAARFTWFIFSAATMRTVSPYKGLRHTTTLPLVTNIHLLSKIRAITFLSHFPQLKFHVQGSSLRCS